MQESINTSNELLNTTEFYVGFTSTIIINYYNDNVITETKSTHFDIKNADGLLLMEDINVITITPGASKSYTYLFTPPIEGTYVLNAISTDLCNPLGCNITIL